MRFLKTLTLNRRAIYDDRLAVTTLDAIVMNTPKNLLIPKGVESNRPGSPVNGMIRYNTDTNQFEGYQAGAWRQFRFKEPTTITQQNLGAGNDEEVYFGPLNPNPGTYLTTASGMTWNTTQMAKNMLVVVENVLQISGTNYTVVQNPSIGAEVYSPVTSVSLSSGATVLYFNTALAATGASGAAGTVTLTFSTRAFEPFSVGSSIVVTDFQDDSLTGLEFNGTFTVTACTTSSVSYTNATTATMTFAGQITSTDAVYPSVNFNGSTITGSASLEVPTTITSFTTDTDTGALVSVTFTSDPTTNTIADDVTLTITESTSTGSGYYLKFNTPVPDGKIVTALIGFDQ